MPTNKPFLSSLSNGDMQGGVMSNYWWLWESWHALGLAPFVDPLLAVVALACGLVLGGERQRREKPAGLRTLSLVCLGAAVFTMLSFHFTSVTGDSGRVAAQIVTGIGFLGAGVILHGRRIVSGVTTAAIIWVAAAIGMTLGSGYVLAGLGLTFLVNRLLVGIFLYETRWHPDLHEVCVVIGYAAKQGLTRVRLERILSDYELTGVEANWTDELSDQGRLTLRMRLPRVRLYELLAELVEIPEVQSVVRERCELVKSTALA